MRIKFNLLCFAVICLHTIFTPVSYKCCYYLILIVRNSTVLNLAWYNSTIALLLWCIQQVVLLWFKYLAFQIQRYICNKILLLIKNIRKCYMCLQVASCYLFPKSLGSFRCGWATTLHINHMFSRGVFFCFSCDCSSVHFIFRLTENKPIINHSAFFAI